MFHCSYEIIWFYFATVKKRVMITVPLLKHPKLCLSPSIIERIIVSPHLWRKTSFLYLLPCCSFVFDFFRCKVDVIIIVRSIRSNSVLLIQLQFNSVELRARFWIAWFSGFLNWPLGHAVILEQQQYTKSFLN